MPMKYKKATLIYTTKIHFSTSMIRMGQQQQLARDQQLHAGVAIVTGAANGIGAAVVKRLAASTPPYRIIALDNQYTKSIEDCCAADFLGDKKQIIEIQCDVTQNNQVQAVFDLIVRYMKRVDVLVSCAGVARDAPLNGVGPATRIGDRLEFTPTTSEQHTAAWRLQLDVNLVGSAIVAHHFVRAKQQCCIGSPPSLKDSTGNMIFISSMIAVLYHSMGFWMYRASKVGLQVVVEGIRQELRQVGSKIRITTILPCPVQDTQLFAHEGAHHQTKYFSGFTCLQPSDVADAVMQAVQAAERVEMTQIQLNTCDLPVDVRYVQQQQQP